MTTDLDSIPRDRLRCMIRNIAAMVERTRAYRGKKLQHVVMRSFGVGATTAYTLCLRADFSPSATIPLKP